MGRSACRGGGLVYITPMGPTLVLEDEVRHRAGEQAKSSDFGAFLLRGGVIDAKQMATILAGRASSRPPLGKVLVRRGDLTLDQVGMILDEQAQRLDCFGEIGIRLGLISPAILNSALQDQYVMTSSSFDIIRFQGLLDNEVVLRQLSVYIRRLEDRLAAASTQATNERKAA